MITGPIFPERLQNLIPVGMDPPDDPVCAQVTNRLYFLESGANAKHGRVELTGLSGDEQAGTPDRVFQRGISLGEN